VSLVRRFALARLRPAGPRTSLNHAIFLKNRKAARCAMVTTGYLNDTQTVFEPEGHVSIYDRPSFDRVYGTFEPSLPYATRTAARRRRRSSRRESPLSPPPKDYENAGANVEDKETGEKKRMRNDRNPAADVSRRLLRKSTSDSWRF